MAFRIDRQPDGLMEPVRREDGTLFVHARVARPGIYEYQEDGESVRELVPREELYDPESLETLGRVPYTDGHPGEPVDAENVDDHQAGDVGKDVEVDDKGFVKVKIAVRSKDAIRNVLDGTKDETSPGYHCDARPTSGEHPEFGEFDRIQTNRTYNHVAGVESARGGPSIRMRTDANDEWLSGVYRADVGQQMRATREAMRLAQELADLTDQEILKQIASRIDASRSDVLNMLRGSLAPTAEFLRAFADVVGFDRSLLLEARSKDESRQQQKSDATPDNPANLPLAPRSRDWDAGQAVDNLQQFYEFNPAEDPTPDPYGDNFAARPPKGSDAYNNVSSFWGPFVDVVDGERRIVPEAIIALQGAIQGARSEPDLPADTDQEDVRRVVDQLWSKAWNKLGPEEWPAEEPVWNREDRSMPHREDSLRAVLRGRMAPLDKNEADIVGEVAQMSDVTEPTVWGYLTGKVSENPDPDVIEAFAQVLPDMSASEILKAAGLGDQVSELSSTQTKDGEEAMPEDVQKLFDNLEQTLSQLEDFRSDDSDGEANEDQGEGEMNVELPEEVQQAVENASSMLEDLMPALKRLKKQKEALQSKIEKLRGKIETLTGATGAESGGQTGETPQQEPKPSGGSSAPEDADAPSLDGEAREDADEIRFDSIEDFQAYQQERRELERVAEHFRIDVADAGTNLAIKRRIVEDATDKDLDGASREKIEGMFEGLEVRSDYNSRNYDRAAQQTGSALERAGTSNEAAAQQEYDQRWAD